MLGEPPPRARLTSFPLKPTAGLVLHRIVPRGVTLLDQAGAQAPYGDERWLPAEHRVDDDEALTAGLGGFGATVVRADVDLPVVRWEDRDHSHIGGYGARLR